MLYTYALVLNHEFIHVCEFGKLDKVYQHVNSATFVDISYPHLLILLEYVW